MQAPKEDGQTALHEAAEGGHLETVRLLLSIGADAGVKDKVRSRPSSYSLPFQSFPLARQDAAAFSGCSGHGEALNGGRPGWERVTCSHI